MNWAHLPLAGGIYDQHPKLIEEWTVMFGVQADHQRKNQEREKAAATASKAGSKSGRRR